MASTSRKSTLKNSTKLPSMNGDTPKKVRFSAAGGTSKKFTAEDVLSMLNDSSLSEAENSSSDEEWIVTKAKNSTPVELIQKSESSHKISRKENEVVSPLKLLRKPEYEVNKATNKHKKSESAVSPIVIKRRTETKKIRTEASEAVSSDPLIQSSKSNDLANHDGGDTENDITSINKSTPSKVRKTTQSIATPNSATKKERKQFVLESSDEFDEKISKLRIADTPVKQIFINMPNTRLSKQKEEERQKLLQADTMPVEMEEVLAKAGNGQIDLVDQGDNETFNVQNSASDSEVESLSQRSSMFDSSNDSIVPNNSETILASPAKSDSLTILKQSKVTKTTQSIATPNSATKKERKQFELESSDEFDETIGKLRIADTPVKQVSRNIADDVSLFKRLNGTPERGKSQKSSRSIDDVPLSKKLAETPEKGKSQMSSRSIDDVPLSKKLAETPEKGKSQMVPFNGRSENTPQSERRSSKRIPVKKKIFDPDEEMECAVSPPKRRSVRASNVDSPRLSRKSATQNITVVSDSDFEMEESKTPKKRKSVRKPVAISESDFEMEVSKTVIKRKSVRKSVAITDSDFEKEESKTLNQRKSVRKSDSEMEESKSPMKRKPVRKTVAISDSDIEMEESKTPMKRKSVRNSVARSYKEKDNSDIEISSPEVKRTPRRSTMVARSYKEKDNSDIEISSPEVKRTPRRSTMKPRESFVDSPDLRKQLLTPRFSARKKLDLSSPSSVKKVGSGFLSPVVNERARRSILGTPTSQIAEARASLHTGNIPTSLPCREKEFENILNFLSRKIEDKAGGCMYISGVPGTGKTATVHAVVRTLQEQVITGDMPKFDFIEINALRLTEPRQAYTRIWNELSGEKVSADSAMKALEKKYTHKNKRPSVVLVDELDYLCNRRQDVIYNILEWSTKSTAALTVISIANTMDLPERTLKGKVTSRMGLTRLVFQPYTFQQLQMIVMNRLGENLSFHVDAVQLVARKVAAVSGDARRALDICRRVTELVSSDTEIIKVTHVEKAISQIFSGTRVRAIKGCSIMCQYLLRAMRDEFQRTGVEESTVGQVYSQFTTICAFEGCEPAQIGVVLSLCTILSDSGLILAEKSRTDLYRKIALNVSADDIFYACNA